MYHSSMIAVLYSEKRKDSSTVAIFKDMVSDHSDGVAVI
jgi:hypothetical protein